VKQYYQQTMIYLKLGNIYSIGTYHKCEKKSIQKLLNINSQTLISIDEKTRVYDYNIWFWKGY